LVQNVFEGRKETATFENASRLADLWRQGDDSAREVILTHIFEHILDIKELRAIFESWSADSELAPAYFKGVEYAVSFAAANGD
jgi:hypothetical protein